MLTSFQLYYFGNCISFIQFIFIMNFMPLLSGRMISAPTVLKEKLQKQKTVGLLFFVNPTVNFLLG